MREPDGAAGGWGQPNAPDASGDNPNVPAGYTYFGQFLDHDVTFDATSRLQVRNDPEALVNFRTPRFDLDSLYGSGPVDEPFQYDQTIPGRLLLPSNTAGEIDLPRNGQDVALIGDPRNDENVIVSGLQIAFIRAHNKLSDMVDAEGTVPSEDRFDAARTRLRWHYQWTIVHDFLPRICGGQLIGELLEHPPGGKPKWRLQHYKPKSDAFLPVEFSVAAYRYGHSQVRASYLLNDTVGVRPIFAPGDTAGELDDLRGNRRLPAQWSVGWPHFLPIQGSSPQPSRRIDSKLTGALFDLPRVVANEPQSLAFRNLKRGQALGLPAGQAVASKLGATPLSGAQLGTSLDPTPLWFYILKESELTTDETGQGGSRLGPIGARIVAEVFLGLLRADPSSYLSLEPTWTPTLPGASGMDGTFGLPDLVAFGTAS